jgi:cobyrinic acid a,c-diamide synthase
MNVRSVTRAVPRVIISGVSAGVGKSLVMTGLVSLLRQQGSSISCCVVGSALHQGLIYNRLSRRYSHTIDRAVLDVDQVFQTLAHAQIGADLLLIDGRGGVYDGTAPGDLFGSDADLAALTKTPIVLVADVEHFSNSIVALVKGYLDFDANGVIKAILANRLPGCASEAAAQNSALTGLNEALDLQGLPRFFGGLPVAPFAAPIPPSICSQHENVTSIARDFFLDIAQLVSRHVDLDEIQAIASTAAPIDESHIELPTSIRNCRIAVSDDSCFNVGYQDNLAWLSYLGAELVPFSPLTDLELPRRIGGVYVTGAYLHSDGKELSKNESMRAALKRFVEQGGALFSEGAGTAYLCKAYQLEADGPLFPGVGIVPVEAIPVAHEQETITASLLEDTILGPPGSQLKGVSTGEWNFRGAMPGAERSIVPVSRVVTTKGQQLSGIFSPAAQAVSTFHLLHFGSNPGVAQSFIQAASVLLASSSDEDGDE